MSSYSHIFIFGTFFSPFFNPSEGHLGLGAVRHAFFVFFCFQAAQVEGKSARHATAEQVKTRRNVRKPRCARNLQQTYVRSCAWAPQKPPSMRKISKKGHSAGAVGQKVGARLGTEVCCNQESVARAQGNWD